MFGKLLSGAIKAATLPIDGVNAGLDIITGGSGSKASRNDPDLPNPLSILERMRDRVADAAEDIDE